MFSGRTAVTGTCIENNRPPKLSENKAKVILGGECAGERYSLPFTDKDLSKHIRHDGSPRSGKTNTILSEARQICNNAEKEDSILIFDTRGEFKEALHDPERGDVILSATGEGGVRQNVFKEVMSIPKKDKYARLDMIREICESLVPDGGDKDGIFHTTAAELLQGVMCNALGRFEGTSHEYLLSNELLRDVVGNASINNRHDLMQFQGDPKWGHLETYLSNNSSAIATSVFLFAMPAVTQAFSGVFGEPGDFSIRDYIRRGGGGVLFIEYDVERGETLSHVDRMFINIALKTALGRDRGNGKKYFFLDEFPILPKLKSFGDACAFGGGMGLRLFAGIQNINQIYAKYGKEEGKSILASFGNVISFRNVDPDTVEYTREMFGKNQVETKYSNGYRIQTVTQEDWVVNDETLQNLGVGQAVVRLPMNGASTYPPFVFKFDEFKY